ncbi:MAG: cysteine desulfurase [Rhodospirillaceae bacterium]|nr:MAG: cysteine desulfurase [Rhodospirillaceae bacterium]
METSSGPEIVYLDTNATAPVRPSARAAIAQAMDRYGNPSSVHRSGRDARALVEDAREALAVAVGANPAQVIFTSGATEANALALHGLAGIRSILASAVEHPSVLAHVTAEDHVPVDAAGVINLAALDAALAVRPGPVLLAVMAANNETGVIQPLAEVVAIARRHGALVHCDAVQALGKMPLDMAVLGVDSMALSGHKIGAAKGIGALVLRPGLEAAAQSVGGGQERRRRAGTENTLGIAAFGAVLREIADIVAMAPRIAALRDHLERDLRTRVPALQLFGADGPRLPNTLCMALPGVSSETQIMALDLAHIAVSAGAACSSGKISPSHVLLAMGVAPDLAGCAIRVSLGWDTTAEELDRFKAVFEQVARKRAQAGGTPRSLIGSGA